MCTFINLPWMCVCEGGWEFQCTTLVQVGYLINCGLLSMELTYLSLPTCAALISKQMKYQLILNRPLQHFKIKCSENNSLVVVIARNFFPKLCINPFNLFGISRFVHFLRLFEFCWNLWFRFFYFFKNSSMNKVKPLQLFTIYVWHESLKFILQSDLLCLRSSRSTYITPQQWFSFFSFFFLHFDLKWKVLGSLTQ